MFRSSCNGKEQSPLTVSSISQSFSSTSCRPRSHSRGAVSFATGSSIYLKKGDTAVVTVTVENDGPANATAIAPSLTFTVAPGGTLVLSGCCVMVNGSC